MRRISFASFVGTGTFNVQIAAQFLLTNTSPPTQSQTLLPGSSAAGTATLTYIYGVPEPSSLALAGVAAAAGLGAWLRRQRALRVVQRALRE